MSLSSGSFPFQLFYILILIVLIVKAIIAVYLFFKIIEKKKRIGKLEFDFLFSMFILFVCLFISRLFFFIFDFYLTQLDSTKYYLVPNIYFWKLGTFISTIGFVVMVFTVDYKGVNFKFKGIPAYILLALAIFKFTYPIHSEADFIVASGIAVYESPFILIILIIFIYIGITIDGLRRIAFIVVIAVIIYAGGGLLIGEQFLGPLREQYGDQALISIYSLFAITKLIGLILLGYTATKLYIQK